MDRVWDSIHGLVQVWNALDSLGRLATQRFHTNAEGMPGNDFLSKKVVNPPWNAPERPLGSEEFPDIDVSFSPVL